jgi:hypothetical protein
MDYLPIQVLSVPCKCIFLSAKETDTLKRNQIHLMLMEVLQMLKFSLKKDRQSISFTNGWNTEMSEMSWIGAQGAAKEDLLGQLVIGNN